MLIEDAIAMLQLHEVPGKAAKMRAYYKVERVYWGLTTPVLDDQARQWRQDLSLADRLQLAAELWASNAHEGRICAAKLLTQARIRPDDNAAWQLLQTWLAEVDCAAICDHLCLAGHRRLSADVTRMDEMAAWPQSPHLWTRRSSLAMTLPWAKMRNPNAANLAIRERALGWAAELAEDPSKSYNRPWPSGSMSCHASHPSGHRAFWMRIAINSATPPAGMPAANCPDPHSWIKSHVAAASAKFHFARVPSDARQAAGPALLWV